jgi:hypothetical protein
MPGLISDEILGECAVIAPIGDLSAALTDRYGGLVDRLALYLPFKPGERDDFWKLLLRGL